MEEIAYTAADDAAVGSVVEGGVEMGVSDGAGDLDCVGAGAEVWVESKTGGEGSPSQPEVSRPTMMTNAALKLREL
ncbi:hypothetical protein [Arthrobacter sp. H20]|uniref:hypothetical protein n=1 Tax=Arthrobacter sp. H20 TaxID=1267981 RepID=UPI00047CEC89|nr:hypothetical protein [Arthrobacter sp. H20]